MDYVGSLDSSRDLQPIYGNFFVNILHLILYVCIEIFNVMFFCIYEVYRVGNRALVDASSHEFMRWHAHSPRLMRRQQEAGHSRLLDLSAPFCYRRQCTQEHQTQANIPRPRHLGVQSVPPSIDRPSL